MLKKVILLFLVAQILAISIPKNLNEQIKKNGDAEVFIIFKEHVNFKALEAAKKINLDTMDHSIRGKLVVNTLKDLAKKTQKNVVDFLKKKNIDFYSYWITNAIVLKKADLNLLLQLKNTFSHEIEQFELVGQDHIVTPQSEMKLMRTLNNRVELGVEFVKAPEVWAKGFRGQGIVVGVIDTGTFLHDDLKESYRGRNGNHNYNWFDALNGRSAPYDDNFHGTHCQGTINGNSSSVTVGVAPGAEWISCKYLSGSGGGSVANSIKCMEFMLEPHDLNGRNGNSDKRPHLVSNSYGGSHQVARERALDAMLAGGVEMVYANGNSGSRCGSSNFPARYPPAFSVGALNRGANTIASFSSRGPGNEGSIKPEISAPGVQVSSTSNRGGYRSASGTSMACPHVAGVIALIWSANPSLARNIKETRDIIQRTASPKTESNLCGPPVGSPNNVFGYGTINALAAVNEAQKKKY